ncbi:MAG: VOC family protein [Chloroflexi bacterium]|nr:VOC family protein [Chloroflexota bacterium]
MAIIRSHHIALKSPDYQRAKAFYTETLGFAIRGSIPGKDVIFIDIGGTTIELSEGPAPTCEQRPNCGLMHLAFEVDDVDATYAKLKAKGVEFFVEPKCAGDIRLAFFRDPDGNELELFKSPTLTWK